MNRTISASIAVAIMAGASLAADYNFPSHAIPGNVNKEEVKQIVSFIWDDNAYSGLARTHYETAPGQMFADQSWIGGEKPWGAAAPNKDNIQPGETGMSWSFTKLAGRKNELPPAQFDPANVNIKQGFKCTYNDTIWEATGWMDGKIKPGLHPKYPEKNGDWEHPWKYISTLEEFMQGGLEKTNPDGSPILFTYNMITGLFAAQFENPETPGKAKGDYGYQYRVTKYGYWQVNEKDKIEFPHLSVYKEADQVVPTVWGREQPVKLKESDEGNVNGETYGQINAAARLAQGFGHEMGNHTLDHIETNSALTSGDAGFGRWGGEGFHGNMDHKIRIGSDILGWTERDWNEAEEFDRTPGISWHSMGWIPEAGRQVSKKAWKGMLEIGEEPYLEYFGWKPRRDGGIVSGFRAPRLEVNSNMFFALAELGYLYDTGLEGGHDETKDGTNFVWPYTVDNGIPHTFAVRKNGATNVAIDSLPVGTGLWEYPVNVVIVHPDDRSEVYDAYTKIMKADGEDVSAYKDEWVQNNGKITCFDFNMFVLWGMTGPQAERALNYTLDLRMKGNKAPLHVGCHTDYFSPIYDIATLMSPENENSFGLALEYNNWKTRQTAFENFVDYGLSKGAYFWTGEQTINYVKELASKATIGDTKVDVAPDSWSLMSEGGATGTETVSNLDNISMTIPTGEAAWGGYYASVDGSKFKGLSHIELDYTTNAPLYFSFNYGDGSRREVLLNNLGVKDVKSGLIPYEAFEEKSTGTADRLDPTNIIGIAVYPQKIGDKEAAVNFSAKNIAFHVGAPVGVTKQTSIAKSTIALNGIQNGDLKLSVGSAGNYSVDLYSASGRLVKSLSDVPLASGAQSVAVGDFSAGLYIVKVTGMASNVVSKIVVH